MIEEETGACVWSRRGKTYMHLGARIALVCI
jgi:hypothetical protein